MIFLTTNLQVQEVQQIALHCSISNHLHSALWCPISALTTLMHGNHKTSASGRLPSLSISFMPQELCGHGAQKISSNMSRRIQGILITKVGGRVMTVKMHQEIRPHRYLISQQIVTLDMTDGVQTKDNLPTRRTSRLPEIWICLMWSWPCGREQRERAKEDSLAVML